MGKRTRDGNRIGINLIGINQPCHPDERSISSQKENPPLKPADHTPLGCRSTLGTVLGLAGTMGVFYLLGWILLVPGQCSGWCEQIGFIWFYGAGPFGALFTVFTGDLVAAYPLEFTGWITLGVWLERRRGVQPWVWVVRWVGGILTLSWIYGLVLSTLTVVDRS